MNVTSSSGGQRPYATLRRLMRPRSRVEPCELCSAALPAEHQHLIDPESRQLRCCCDACAVLFGEGGETKFRRVPRRCRYLPDFRMDEAQWEGLALPINVAFFFHSTPAGRVVACYPSPAGATESLLGLEAWDELVNENPVLRELEPDVEALLVNRLGEEHEYYRAPMDECYRLVGLIRANWHGLSGGIEVRRAMTEFFNRLKERSRPWGARAHA